MRSALSDAVRQELVPRNVAKDIGLSCGRKPKAQVWTPGRVAAFEHACQDRAERRHARRTKHRGAPIEITYQDWRATPRPSPVMVWTAAQTSHFVDATTTDPLHPLYHLIAHRGLRRGEAVGLRWSDVDLDDATLTVAQQIVQVGWTTERGEPKTDAGARTIPLSAETVALLRAHRSRQRTAQALPDLVFADRDGLAYHPEYVTRHFTRTTFSLDLPPIRLHDLRHVAATLMLAAGNDLKLVQDLLGHSTIVLTGNTYTTVLPEVAREAAEGVAKLLRDAQPADAATRTQPTWPRSRQLRSPLPRVQLTPLPIEPGLPGTDLRQEGTRQVDKEERNRRRLIREATAAEEADARSRERSERWRTERTRLTWEEYAAEPDVACRGCGRPMRNDDGDNTPANRMTDAQRYARDAEEAAWKAAHPDCRGGRWGIQGSSILHCNDCCPPPPVSPAQWDRLAAIFKGGSAEPTNLDVWRLTLRCGHQIDYTMHRDNRRVTFRVHDCPDCGERRGYIDAERIGPAAVPADQRRVAAGARALDAAETELRRAQKRLAKAQERLDKVRGADET